MFNYRQNLMCSSACTSSYYCYHQAEKESGRSMTEMLGVLAVIGVLSVGGIAGYRYAMDKHRANELLAGASRRAVLVAAQITAGQTPSLAEFSKMNDTAGGTFDSAIKEWDDEFGIKVSGVKESVCKNLVKATEDMDIILAKTDGSDLTESDCSGDNNTFMFVYSNDMGAVDFVFDEDDEGCVGRDCPSANRYECHSGYIWEQEGNSVDIFSVCPTGSVCHEFTDYYAENCGAGCMSALCIEQSAYYLTCHSGQIVLEVAGNFVTVVDDCPVPLCKEGSTYSSTDYCNTQCRDALCVTMYYYCTGGANVIHAYPYGASAHCPTGYICGSSCTYWNSNTCGTDCINYFCEPDYNSIAYFDCRSGSNSIYGHNAFGSEMTFYMCPSGYSCPSDYTYSASTWDDYMSSYFCQPYIAYFDCWAGSNVVYGRHASGDVLTSYACPSGYSCLSDYTYPASSWADYMSSYFCQPNIAYFACWSGDDFFFAYNAIGSAVTSYSCPNGYACLYDHTYSASTWHEGMGWDICRPNDIDYLQCRSGNDIIYAHNGFGDVVTYYRCPSGYCRSDYTYSASTWDDYMSTYFCK